MNILGPLITFVLFMAPAHTCLTCRLEGHRSRLSESGPVFATAMAGGCERDEEGRLSCYDPNRYEEFMQCSRGHHWTRVYTLEWVNGKFTKVYW
jgi:hypothetical protein